MPITWGFIGLVVISSIMCSFGLHPLTLAYYIILGYLTGRSREVTQLFLYMISIVCDGSGVIPRSVVVLGYLPPSQKDI